MIKPSQTRDPEIHQSSLYFGLLFTIDFLRVFKVLLLRLLHNLTKKQRAFTKGTKVTCTISGSIASRDG